MSRIISNVYAYMLIRDFKVNKDLTGQDKRQFIKVRGARGRSLGPILQVGAHLPFQDPPRRSLTSAPVCTNVHFLDYTMEHILSSNICKSSLKCQLVSCCRVRKLSKMGLRCSV